MRRPTRGPIRSSKRPHSCGGSSGHPFLDGNKRTAFVVARVFLRLNGYDVDMADDEKVELVVGIANGGLTVEQTADTLRPRLRQTER